MKKTTKKTKILFVLLVLAALAIVSPAMGLTWPSEDEHGGIRALPTCDSETQVLEVWNNEVYEVVFSVRNNYDGTNRALVKVIPPKSKMTVNFPAFLNDYGNNQVDFVVSKDDGSYRHNYMFEYKLELKNDCIVESQSLIGLHLAGQSYQIFWVNSVGDEEIINSGVVSPYGNMSGVYTVEVKLLLHTYADGVLVQINEVSSSGYVCYSYAAPGMVERENGSAQPCN